MGLRECDALVIKNPALLVPEPRNELETNDGTLQGARAVEQERSGRNDQRNSKVRFRAGRSRHGSGWAIKRDADGHLMDKNITSYDEARRRIRTEYIPMLRNEVRMGGTFG